MTSHKARALGPGDVLTADEVQRLAGLSYRRLDYYVRNGYVRPVGDPLPGSGHQRVFDARQALKAAILARASAVGIRPSHLGDPARSVAATLESTIVELRALHEAAKANHL